MNATANAIIIGIPAISNISCNGGNNGKIVQYVTGGSGQISYLWSNGNTNSTIDTLLAGTYTVTASDANGCTASASYVVTEPSPIQFDTVNIVDQGCASGGSITTSASGGTGSISFFVV